MSSTHMRSRFGVRELDGWEPAEPFEFTKGLRTMRVPAVGTFRINPWQHGTLLWDLESDPSQSTPIIDDDVELRMLGHLVRLLRRNDAPASQFERLGLPVHNEPGLEHLRVRTDAQRASAVAEPLPDLLTLPASDLLTEPVHELLASPHARAILREHLPWLVENELVAALPNTSLWGIARTGGITAADLQMVAQQLAGAIASVGAGDEARP